ncbi:F0F1 ATP synthase subunit delta [Aestuariimicrobium ganziense]|uniref:F0F1 ATP synthase subunit delta n=1 Tax=Aestuariimicrobium ganziense TaxID=2773677 RepID=UPI001942CD33|nr:F0F1 ATP synthase subunit delta [Aestuariimicrobium ganziense]
MSQSTDSRLRELDAVLDQQGAAPELASQLFAIVDVLDTTPALRRALSDPAADESAKGTLVDRLFGTQVGAGALAVLKAAAVRRWGSPKRLADAVERQAVRAEFSSASSAGQLDQVSDELFRFGQTVAGNDELREALGNGRVPLAARRQLVTTLLAGKASPATVRLAERAVSARERTYALTLDNYATTAAQLRDRQVAKVTVAQPLTADQDARLRAALIRIAGRQVDVQVTVDPEVLGGMRVQLGDEVIEGTIAQRLEDARRQIA